MYLEKRGNVPGVAGNLRLDFDRLFAIPSPLPRGGGLKSPSSSPPHIPMAPRGGVGISVGRNDGADTPLDTRAR